VSERPRQRWDPERYARNARFVADLARPVVDLLDLQPGQRILDLGCGDGHLTRQLHEMGGRLVGIDGSDEQIAAAQRLGLDARLADAESLGFEGEFDVVFSNAALHWMKRPERVIDGVWRALVPGGRFVAEFGGAGCVAGIVEAVLAALARRGIDGEALHPWYFPDAETYSALLEARGFAVDRIELVPRPTRLPGRLAAWLETFGEPFHGHLSPEQRSAFLDEVEDSLRKSHCDAQGVWTADYVRLRFAATRPV
jgi:trans-aconitate methyltransferase